jgi:hypothetical protein
MVNISNSSKSVLSLLPNIMFLLKLAVGLMTLLITLVLFFKLTEVKQTLERVRGF